MTWWELDATSAICIRPASTSRVFPCSCRKNFLIPLVAPDHHPPRHPFLDPGRHRGAIGGLTLGVGIGIVYWAVSALTEAMGAIGQLPPFMAAWSPDAVFVFLGLYFFFKMPT